MNNGGYKLEPNTTYTLSVYARKPSASAEDSNFNLFAYDGNAQITHGSTDDIINNSFKSDNLIVDSDQFKRYQFTFTTGDVTYIPGNNTDVNGTSNPGTTANPRFGIVFPKAISDPTTGTITIWGLQLEKSPRATTYVLNDGTDNYDNPKEAVNLSNNPSNYIRWYGSNWNNPSTYPNLSLGLTSGRSNGAFAEKYLPRSANHQAPAIFEYPGIINSLDGGPSKESLSAQDWVYNNLFNSVQETDLEDYFTINMSDDKIYSYNSYESNRYLSWEIETSKWPHASTYRFVYSNYNEAYYTSYDNGYRTAYYWWSQNQLSLIHI